MKPSEHIVQLIKDKCVLRRRDLESYSIHPETLNRLVQKEEVIRIGRGLYSLPDMEVQTSFQTFIEVTQKIPQGVVCLLSALVFHEIATQAPYQLWLAIGEKARLPRDTHTQVRFVRFSQKLLEDGVQEYIIQNVPIKITTPARTVADCFKYRNKIGLDVAVEALKEGLQDHRFTIDELVKYARLCRVGNVMQPYIEAIVT